MFSSEPEQIYLLNLILQGNWDSTSQSVMQSHIKAQEYLLKIRGIYWKMLGLESCGRETLSTRLQIKWGKFCLIFCKAEFGFILLKVPWPYLLLGECHINCSGFVCSSCFWLHWTSTMSSWSTTKQFYSFTKNTFFVLLSCESFPSWFIFFNPILKVETVFLGRKQKFLGIVALLADVNFLAKKSRLLDVIFLLSIAGVIIIALMFYQC